MADWTRRHVAPWPPNSKTVRWRSSSDAKNAGKSLSRIARSWRSRIGSNDGHRRPRARRLAFDRDRGLERLADELRLANGGEVDPADERACLRVDVDEAFVGESDQGFADRRPAHAEARRHLGLGDRLTGPHRDPDDGIAQGVVDLGDDRPAAVDLRPDAADLSNASRTGSSGRRSDVYRGGRAAYTLGCARCIRLARPVIAWTSPCR